MLSKDSKNINLKIDNPEKLKITIVVSEWHSEITNKLFKGAKNVLTNNGLLEENINRVDVPGSFELIFAAKNLNIDLFIQTVGMKINMKTNAMRSFSSKIKIKERSEAKNNCMSMKHLFQRFSIVCYSFQRHRLSCSLFFRS